MVSFFFLLSFLTFNVHRDRERRIQLAASVFVLVVLYCDEYYQIEKNTDGAKAQSAAAARFFRIASQLPIELQMVLCYRLVGSAKQNIPPTIRKGAIDYLINRL